MEAGLVLADFIATEHSELSVNAGDIINVKVNLSLFENFYLSLLKIDFKQILPDSNWCYAYLDNAEGFVPLNVIKLLRYEETNEKLNSAKNEESKRIEVITNLIRIFYK